ncbi:MAG: hypothetical protein ABW162_15080 [Candidatus Sedimenticola sp. PURPLELP]
MFGNLFKRSKDSRWETSLKKGILVRKCRRTGRSEYRDCKLNQWVLLESEEVLKTLQKELYYAAPLSIDR